MNFNPRAPCGARPAADTDFLSPRNFNPRAPCGARQCSGHQRPVTFLFQPTRPLRGATGFGLWERYCAHISTHAPLAGRDSRQRDPLFLPCIFQPTRPLRGATVLTKTPYGIILFQPTRPLRGATAGIAKSTTEQAFQPTRPLRGATWMISRKKPKSKFQPTRPLRGATSGRWGSCHRQDLISTHAPLAGRD